MSTVVTPASAAACPGCGTALQVPRVGRRPRWCSKSCRQAGHRARRTAERAAETAAVCIDQLADARAELGTVVGGLDVAYAAMARALEAADGDVDVLLRTGERWEPGLQTTAHRIIQAADRLAELTRQHERAADDYRSARASLADPTAVDLGLRRTPANSSISDETPHRLVANTAAKASATKPATPPTVEVDRDALFDAVEDVVYELNPTRTHLLPDDVDQALAAPASNLAELVTHQSDDGPIEGMLTAARRLLDAARPFHDRADIPDRILDTLAALKAALPDRPGEP